MQAFSRLMIRSRTASSEGANVQSASAVCAAEAGQLLWLAGFTCQHYKHGSCCPDHLLPSIYLAIAGSTNPGQYLQCFTCSAALMTCDLHSFEACNLGVGAKWREANLTSYYFSPSIVLLAHGAPRKTTRSTVT